MTRDEEILEIQRSLGELSASLSAQQQRIHELQSRLQELQTGTASQPEQDHEKFFNRKSSSQGDKLTLENFIGLRLMHLVGIVVLVIGIAIGVKYAVDRELISEVARISLAYASGFVLLFLSTRLKAKYQLFSAILFSGAMASLYFTTYAALVYYSLFPFFIAFVLMVLITVVTAIAAIQYDRQEIAILGMIGAYGIPFLISANSGKVHLFFAYIVLINAGIAFLSYKRNWKSMILLSMVVTWALYLGWAAFRYQPVHLSSAVVFMAAFYLLFSFASLAFPMLKQQPLQLIEVQHFVYNNVFLVAAALTIFSERQFDSRCIPVVGYSFLFFCLQSLVVGTLVPREKLLFKYLAAMAVISLVFYIGMRWDGLFVTMAWIFIAIALFVSGVLSKMAWLRLMAIILTGVTLLKLIIVDRGNFNTLQKIISYVSIGVLLLIVSFFYQKFVSRDISRDVSRSGAADRRDRREK